MASPSHRLGGDDVHIIASRRAEDPVAVRRPLPNYEPT
jgi:hypothetical protein